MGTNIDAYHEVGHCLLSLHHNARVTRLAVGRAVHEGRPIAGICSFDRRGLSRIQQAEIYLAGAIAEHCWMVRTRGRRSSG